MSRSGVGWRPNLPPFDTKPRTIALLFNDGFWRKAAFIRKRDLVSTTNEYKIIQFPTGKEIAKPCQSAQARAGRLAKGHSRNIGWNENTLFPPTYKTQRPTRSGSRCRTPERRRSGTNTGARSHEAGLFRWDLTGGDGRSEGAAIGLSAKVRCEERRECPELGHLTNVGISRRSASRQKRSFPDSPRHRA
jgi:hypothetical protein